MRIKSFFFNSLIISIPSFCRSFELPKVRELPENKLAPLQYHLAYHGANGMVVSWNTYQKLDKPTVYYGLSPNELSDSTSSDISVTYQTSLTWNNHVEINGLESDTLYYYRVSYSDDSEIYSFRTAKEAGDSEEFVFAAVVDLGTMGDLGLSETTGQGAVGALAPGERNTILALQQNVDSFEFLLHPGDIAYADYWLKEEIQHYLSNTSISDGYKVYEQILNAYYEEMQVVTSMKPYMVGVGNHEADCDNGGVKDKENKIEYTNSICMEGQTNFTGYKNHFRMPSDISGGQGNFWYSFDYGLVHFIVYDTETDFGNGLEGPEDGGRNGPEGSYPNEQIDFIKNDLNSVDRDKTPWVIALGHRPWYVAGDACDTCQQAFEQLFIDAEVDIIINGHVHNYERIGPIASNKTDPNGLNNPSSPLYILNGIAGHYDGIDPMDYPLPDYVSYGQDTVYGWSRFTVHNCSHITHEFVASSNDSVLDKAVLYKDRKCASKQNSNSSTSSTTSLTTNLPSTGSYNSTTTEAPESRIIESNASSGIDSIWTLSTETQSDIVTETITSKVCYNGKCENTSITNTTLVGTLTDETIESKGKTSQHTQVETDSEMLPEVTPAENYNETRTVRTSDTFSLEGSSSIAQPSAVTIPSDENTAPRKYSGSQLISAILGLVFVGVLDF